MTPPAPTSQPPRHAATRSAASNALGAMLGAQFLCGQCGHWHAPSSRLIKCCQRRFVYKHLDGKSCHQTWHADVEHYNARHERRLQNKTWTATDQETYDRFIAQLHNLRVHDNFGLATLVEISIENGHEILQQRYATWSTEAQQHIAAARIKAQLILTQIDTLLPPPYTVGAPKYYPYYAGPQWQPTAAAQAELDRVANLATPPMRVTLNDHPEADTRIRLHWSPTRTVTTDI